MADRLVYILTKYLKEELRFESFQTKLKEYLIRLNLYTLEEYFYSNQPNNKPDDHGEMDNFKYKVIKTIIIIT